MDRKVVEFRLVPDDISAIRFAVSPGHELCHAVRVLAGPQNHPLQWGWLRLTKPDIPLAAFELLRLVIGEDGYMPDFLTSTPTWDLTPALEFDRLRRADLDAMAVDFGKRADRVEGRQRTALLTMRDSPDRAREMIADAASEFWDAALAPHWSAIERILRADIGSRARRMSIHGVGEMVESINDSVSWGGNAVRVLLSKHAEVLDCRGSGLVLVPSVMSRRCAALTEPPAQPTLFYPSLGVTENWTDTADDGISAVSSLLGGGRARVLARLQQPLSTSEAAAAAGMAISTASHHLTVLRAARLVDSRRVGSVVLHARTALGDALLGGG